MKVVYKILAILAVFLLLWTHPLSSYAKPRALEPFQAALLMEADTGRILFEKEPRKKWQPASMVKMMLMLIVMEQVREGSVKLSDTITVSARAAKMGGSQVFLKEGEQFSLEDLMKATVIASANDAAVAIAEYMGGSVEGFVEMMNRRAKELNLNDTRYATVHGLPPEKGEEGDVTSAYDLAILARELIKYPQVLKWGSTVEDDFRGGKFKLFNTNKLVVTFPGTNGMKTGHFKEAGYNITATATRGDLSLIAVILGAPSSKVRFAEAAKLLASGFANYKKVVAVTKGAPVGPEVPVLKGKLKKTQLVAQDDVVVLIRKGEEKQVRVEMNPVELTAPVVKGKPVAEFTVRLGDRVLGRGIAVTKEEIPKAGLLRRLLNL